MSVDPDLETTIHETTETRREYEEENASLKTNTQSLEKKMNENTRLLQSSIQVIDNLLYQLRPFIDRVRKLELQNLETVSKENLDYLTKEFNLSLSSEKKGNALSEIVGMFDEYSDEKVDSVELLRSLREEE